VKVSAASAKGKGLWRSGAKIIEKGETIPAGDLKFYRDLQFSQGRTTHKTCFSAAWSRTGRKGPYMFCYLRLKSQGRKRKRRRGIGIEKKE
jgi:hypothetical protein